MKHTKAINAICAFGLVLATVVTFDYMNPHSIYHRWGACLIATVVGGIAVIACWGMFTACEDPETRRRLAPFCIPLTVQTLLLPLCDICSLVYPFCIRMNRVLRATVDVFAADLLVQAVQFVLLLYYRRAG